MRTPKEEVIVFIALEIERTKIDQYVNYNSGKFAKSDWCVQKIEILRDILNKMEEEETSSCMDKVRKQIANGNKRVIGILKEKRALWVKSKNDTAEEFVKYDGVCEREIAHYSRTIANFLVDLVKEIEVGED